MAILTHKLPSFTGVKPGQTATCRIPSGYAYHAFYLNLLQPGGQTGFRAIDISEIRLVANGITIQRWDGNTLNWLNQFDGMVPSNWKGDKTVHYLALTCVRNNLKTRAAQEATAIAYGAVNDPRPITTLLIEVDIVSTAPSDVDIVGYATVSGRPDLQGVPSTLKLIRKFDYSPTGAGDFEIADLPRTGAISRVVFTNADKIDEIIVQADSRTLWRRTRYVNDSIIQALDVRKYDANANIFPIDTTEGGNGGDAWNVSGVADLRFTLKMNDAARVGPFVEYLAPLGS